MPEIAPEVLLYIEQREREIRQAVRAEAEKARNEAIGVLAFSVVLLTILGVIGVIGLVKTSAQQAVQTLSDNKVGESYVERARRAALEAEQLRKHANDRTQSIDNIHEKIRALGISAKPANGIMASGDVEAEANKWGSCTWHDISVRQAGYPVEDKLDPATYGCPDGTFLTHFDENSLGSEGPGWFIGRVRCCRI